MSVNYFPKVLSRAAVFMLLPWILAAGWWKDYEGVASGESVHQTADGGYIVTGYEMNTIAGVSNLFLLKTNYAGEVAWKKLYGTDEWWEIGNCVRQTSDDGYIIAGYTESIHRLWLLKTNETGDTTWTRFFMEGVGFCVQQIANSGYIIVGRIAAQNNWNLWVAKIDVNGNIQWDESYGDGLDESGVWIEETSDGGYIVLGYKVLDTISIYSEYEYRAIWLLKTDEQGQIEWERTYGGKKCGHKEYHTLRGCVRETSDGGYILTGSSASVDSGYVELYLIKTDGSGNAVWTRNWGKEESRGIAVDQAEDGGYICLGTGSDYLYDIWLIRTNPDGDTLWFKTYAPKWYSIPNLAQKTLDGGLIVTGFHHPPDGSSEKVFLLKTESNGDTLSVSERSAVESSVELTTCIGNQIILHYSNYSQGFSVSIFDASGRKVDHLESAEASGTITWGKSYGPGVYFFRIESGSSVKIHKAILIR